VACKGRGPVLNRNMSHPRCLASYVKGLQGTLTQRLRGHEPTGDESCPEDAPDSWRMKRETAKLVVFT